MKIACLGWGSLIWRPQNLLIQQKWFEDGPIIPVEFCRESKDKRITLVITENVRPVRVLWALMSTENLEKAIESLQIREGIERKNKERLIGLMKINEKPKSNLKRTILRWLNEKDLDVAIWTDLKPKFKEQDRTPIISEVITHLTELNYEDRLNAEEYIRKAPKQIDTDYRRQIEMKLGWTKLDS